MQVGNRHRDAHERTETAGENRDRGLSPWKDLGLGI